MDDDCIKYIEEKIRGLEVRLLDYITESRRALDKADTSMDHRLNQMNEFRAQILTERADFVRRSDWDSHNHEINQAFKTIEEFVANLKGRIWSIGVGAAIATTILSITISIAVKYF